MDHGNSQNHCKKQTVAKLPKIKIYQTRYGLVYLAGETRFELATHGFGVRYKAFYGFSYVLVTLESSGYSPCNFP